MYIKSLITTKLNFVPRDGFVQAARKVVVRIIAQQSFRLGDVRVGMLDVALAVRAEVRFDIDVKRLRQRVVDVDQIFAAAVRHVKRLA